MDDIGVKDFRLLNGYQMNRTDLISINLGKNLPIRCAKGFPLCLSTFRTVSEPLGWGAAILIQGKEKSVGGVRGEFRIRV